MTLLDLQGMEQPKESPGLAPQFDGGSGPGNSYASLLICP